MNVTQCDNCNNVVKHEQSLYLQLHKVTVHNEKGNNVITAELCQNCYDKLKHALPNLNWKG